MTDSARIYRFNLDPQVSDSVTEFAKIHEHDDRHGYREAWDLWWTLNQEMLDREVRRLKQLGYKGSVHDKIYKAGRYYFRGKNSSKQKPEGEQKRRAYVSMSTDVIAAMDEHIHDNMRAESYTPANGYNAFCAENVDILEVEITRLTAESELAGEEIVNKMKKTYKNRYNICRS